jgi:tRNA splicing endonuclease
MHSAAPITVPNVTPNGGSSSHGSGSVGGSADAQLAAAVLGVAGMNSAGPELWGQYRQHQQNVWAAQQRKASRSKRAAALVAALGPMDTEQEEEQSQMCLVQLSFQEAVFLSLVLNCCHLFAVDSNTDAGEQVEAQQGAAGSAAAQNGQKQQQQQQGSAPSAVLLSGSDLWQWCCQHSTGGAAVFAPQYAAYHHLRCSGWLPLPGLSYGADYVLYQLHPENAHSDFVVTVMVEGAARGAVSSQVAGQQQLEPATSQQQAAVQEPGAAVQALTAAQEQQQDAQEDGKAAAGAKQQGESLPSTQLAWLDACIMHRLARQVLKEMMLLYVVVPAGVSLAEFDCIHSLQVLEVLVQRWVPSEHREVK